MSKNVFVMREEEMENAVVRLDKCYTEADSTGREMPRKFAAMQNTGLFKNGINAINQQVNGLAASLFNVKNIVNKHSNETFQMERAMAKKAGEIEVPQDFVKNNSMATNTFQSILLEKLDGKTVNDGQEVKQSNINQDSILSKTALGDISKKTDMSEQNYNKNSSVLKENLDNINRDSGKEKQELDDSSKIQKKNLQQVSPNHDVAASKLDDRSTVAKTNLTDISNDKTLQEQALDQTTTIAKEAVSDTFSNHSNNKDSGLEHVTSQEGKE